MACAAAALLAASLAGSRVAAQQPAPSSAKATEARLRAERANLEKLRRERTELERQRSSLQNTVHDLADEMRNLDRQVVMTSRVVASLDTQLTEITTQVGNTTGDLVRAQDELALRRAMLRHRLIDIYKRGPLYSVEVLLSATSFGDLVARYKYLHLLTLRDRALVRSVEELRNEIDHQRSNLVRFQNDIQQNLQDKADEEHRLRALEQQQAQHLGHARARARETDARLARIGQDENRLTSVIANLEAARRRALAGAPRGAGVLAHAGGTLAWPVAGSLVYSFGRVVNPNNTTVRWNGIGIEAKLGTPVHAIAAGHVLVAEPFGTYGLTVIIQHAGGDYSVYGSLSKLATHKGAFVSKGEVIGYVGAADPDLPPHLHFELRPQGHAVDPLDYLKKTP